MFSPRPAQLMSNFTTKKVSLKEKFKREMKIYALNVFYLFLFFGMFATYRRLILAQYQISYLSYGISLIEALVLAKVLMVGEMLRLGRGFEHQPLIIPTLYKTIMFTLLVGIFTLLEPLVIGLVRGRSVSQSLDLIISEKYEFIAKCVVTFFAFIPFFGIRELGRVLGKGKMAELFFNHKSNSNEMNDESKTDIKQRQGYTR